MGPASELGYHPLMARDLESVNLKAYEQRAQQTNKIERIFSRLVQKVTPESPVLKAHRFQELK